MQSRRALAVTYVVMMIIWDRLVTFNVKRVNGGTRGFILFDDMIATEWHMLRSWQLLCFDEFNFSVRMVSLIHYYVDFVFSKFRTLSWWQHRNYFEMASSSACRWTISALVAWKLRKFSTLIGLKQFDVIGRAMRDGKARFWLNTERFPFLVTLLVKIRGSPEFWKLKRLPI